MAPLPAYPFDAFVDESHDGQTVYTLAGFLAPREAWTRLWPEWSLAVTEAGIGRFHAVDCEKRSGGFAGWAPQDSERLQRRLLGLIKDPAYGLVSYSVSIDFEAHQRLVPRLAKVFKFPPGLRVNGPLYHPYFMLMQRLVELVVTDSLLLGYAEKDLVGFTFDRQDKAPNAKAVAEAMLRFRPWGNRIRSAGWMNSEAIIPLQVADFLAYETFRHHRDVTLGGGTERWQHAQLNSVLRLSEFQDASNQEAILAHNEHKIADHRATSTARVSRQEGPA